MYNIVHFYFPLIVHFYITIYINKEKKKNGKKSYSTEQIITILRKVEVIVNQGGKIQEACRQMEITEQTYYRWRKEYGGLNISDAKRLKALEKENDRLKKLVADLSLDNQILKDVAMGK